MKKILFCLAFLAILAATIYFIFKYPVWYFSGSAVAAIILHLIEKPLTLAPDDPRFDY